VADWSAGQLRPCAPFKGKIKMINPSLPFVVSIGNDKFEMGNGRYSAFSCEVARDLHRLFDIPGPLAIAASKAICADVGRLNSSVKEIKVGRVSSKTGMMTIKSVDHGIKTPVTPALRVLRCLRTLNEVEYCSEVNPVLRDDLNDWIQKGTPASPIVTEDASTVPA
jgi:hypothetical protein